MHIDQARALRDALTQAIADAVNNGSSEVSLTGALQAADDAARAELQAAIDAASQQPGG